MFLAACSTTAERFKNGVHKTTEIGLFIFIEKFTVLECVDGLIIRPNGSLFGTVVRTRANEVENERTVKPLLPSFRDIFCPFL